MATITDPRDPNKTIDIPPELEGVDVETALEIMETIGSDTSDGEDGKSDDASAGDDGAGDAQGEEGKTGEESAESKDGSGEGADGEGADGESTDESDATKMVPLAAVHEARAKANENKTKAKMAEEENARLKAELEAARKPPAQEADNTTPQKAPEVLYWDSIFDLATKRFQDKEGRMPDDGSLRDAAIVNGFVRDLDSDVREKAAVRYEYSRFKQKEKVKEYAEDLSNFAANRLGKQLVYDEAAPVQEAYSRCERGLATKDDLDVIKNFWVESEQLYLKAQKPAETKQPATPIKVVPQSNAKEIARKAAAMEAHPRAGAIKGGDVGGGYTEEQLEVMLNTMDWDQIPPEAQRMLKGMN